MYVVLSRWHRTLKGLFVHHNLLYNKTRGMSPELSAFHNHFRAILSPEANQDEWRNLDWFLNINLSNFWEITTTVYNNYSGERKYTQAVTEPHNSLVQQ